MCKIKVIGLSEAVGHSCLPLKLESTTYENSTPWRNMSMEAQYQTEAWAQGGTAISNTQGALGQDQNARGVTIPLGSVREGPGSQSLSYHPSQEQDSQGGTSLRHLATPWCQAEHRTCGWAVGSWRPVQELMAQGCWNEVLSREEESPGEGITANKASISLRALKDSSLSVVFPQGQGAGCSWTRNIIAVHVRFTEHVCVCLLEIKLLSIQYYTDLA